ncbi:MAG: hypothetical protein JWN76_3105 [Chitinophagaceae bacterium]|nr:hypothetical protein [Chitinophagaceae bacterium]
MKILQRILFLSCASFFIANLAAAQKITIQGTIYDFLNRKPVEGVSVISNKGLGSTSDSLGRYSISVLKNDSIWFAFLGKNTMRYAADTISNPSAFDIGLRLDIKFLPDVKVRSTNYHLDSLMNRKDYAKIFNFKKPGISLSTNQNYVPGSVSVGLDLDEFINMFRFKRNRQILSLQQRLLQQEQDKYINHRFSKRFVKQLTNLESTALDEFILLYKPAYELLQMMNDLELGYYIQQSFKHYELHRK